MDSTKKNNNEYKRVCIGVQLTEPLHNKLKKAAKEKSLTASAIVRLALLKYFESEVK